MGIEVQQDIDIKPTVKATQLWFKVKMLNCGGSWVSLSALLPLQPLRGSSCGSSPNELPLPFKASWIHNSLLEHGSSYLVL